MTEQPTIPPDMWKVAHLLKFDDAGDQLQAMFLAPPLVVWFALILRKPITKEVPHMKGPDTVEIPTDLSDQALKMLGWACMEALVGARYGKAQYMADESGDVGMN